VSNGNIDKLLNLRSEVHSKVNKELFCIKIDGQFENSERCVQDIIHASPKILSENYTVGAFMVIPKNKGSGIIIYLSKE
jgi:hypothetical protein